MRVFILGGTGSIGSAVTRELALNGHQVLGLCRTEASARRLRDLGGEPVPGDLRRPQAWAALAAMQDAVIQLATDFEQDMGAVDAMAMQALAEAASRRIAPLRLIYTGGCWLYGETGDRVAQETSLKRPIHAFAWMQENAQALQEDPHLSCTVIHPAMVYHEDGGGAFSRFLQEAGTGSPIEIWGSLRTRWPLVHRQDLARAYRLLLEDPAACGEFNVAAQAGVALAEILPEIARRRSHDGSYVLRNRKHVMFKYGYWAEGPTLDQQMSAAKLRDRCGWQPDFPDFQQATF